MLDDTEASGHERRIGQRRVGRRIGARAVVVGERRRLVDEHAAGQVDRQRDARLLTGAGVLLLICWRN